MDFNWITLIGLIAATLTTISFIPQAIKTIKSKNTRDLSLSMYIILAIGVSMWLVYGLIINDLPVTLANAVTSVFIFTILFLKIRYK
jgi:MtN3 and saliva related transmembrane protein